MPMFRSAHRALGITPLWRDRLARRETEEDAMSEDRRGAFARRALLGVAAAGLAPRLARAQRNGGPVVVSSKIDTEGALLGNLVLLALQNANVPTESRLALGPTRIVRTALTAGEI